MAAGPGATGCADAKLVADIEEIVRVNCGGTLDQLTAPELAAKAKIAFAIVSSSRLKARGAPEPPKPRIVAVAVRVGEAIFTQPPPAAHHTLIHKLADMGHDTFVGPSDQGYLTSEGKFVSCELALDIAVRAGQIAKPKSQRRQLFPQDLW